MMVPMALTATEHNKKKERGSEDSGNKIIKKGNGKWQMNSARHKWLATVAKTHFALREGLPLGAIFWACELYLSLFWVLADPLGMLLLTSVRLLQMLGMPSEHCWL